METRQSNFRSTDTHWMKYFLVLPYTRLVMGEGVYFILVIPHCILTLDLPSFNFISHSVFKNVPTAVIHVMYLTHIP